MKRRTFIQTAATLAASSSVNLVQASEVTNPQAKANVKNIYVLVHGTWHGGWIWKKVAQLLRNQGHVVYCPTLTGCGDKKHLASPEVGAETHITDITHLIEYEELTDVILVGHSFSGITITGVADRVKDKIKHIVFFDALVPANNPMSVMTKDKEGNFSKRWLTKREKFIDGYMMDFWSEYPMEMLVPKTYIKERAQLKRLITPHPARAWEDEVMLNNGGWSDLPRSYVHCIGQDYLQTSKYMYGPAKAPGWNFTELAIPRDGMLTHPDLVANYFLKMT